MFVCVPVCISFITPGGESVDQCLYSDRDFVILFTACHRVLNFFWITNTSRVAPKNHNVSIITVWLDGRSLRLANGGKKKGDGESNLSNWQFKQYSAVAHPITLDSAEINSVDKLLGKRTGKKKKGGNSARTPVRSDAVARESPTPWCGEERWPLLFVRLWLHR